MARFKDKPYHDALGRLCIDADVNSQLDYEFDFTAEMEKMEDTIAEAEMMVSSTLEVVAKAISQDGLRVQAFIRFAPDQLDTIKEGSAHEVTCRYTTSHTPARIDDRTMYLVVVKK